MFGHTRRDRIKNKDIQDNVEIASVEDKIQEGSEVVQTYEEEIHEYPQCGSLSWMVLGEVKI